MFSARQILKLTTGLVLGLGTLSATGEPVIHSVEGSFERGERITIKGEKFSEKSKARPHFVWEADHGMQPRSIGRHTEWSRSPSGERVTDIVSPNSSHAVRFDHGTSEGAALAGIQFDSDELFLYRRTYEDFDTSKDYAIRTGVNDIEGKFEIGQTVTGASTGATGVIIGKNGQSTRTDLFYSNTEGSVADGSGDFEYGERMYTDTASFTNVEGSSTYPTGTFRTFNFKTLRMWNGNQNHNIFVGGGRSQVYTITPEYTDGRFHIRDRDVEDPVRFNHYDWKTEEVFYRASSLNEHDGIFDYRHDNTTSYDKRFRTRTDDRDGYYDILFQSQVSNGAQPESYMYYDIVYVDDSWHHVAACLEPVWDQCSDKAIQVPVSWNGEQVEVEFNLRHLADYEDVYLYIVDGDGNANVSGYKICNKCPGVVEGIKVK